MPLFGLMRSYVHAVQRAGGVPLLIPLGLDDESLLAAVDAMDAIVLPGGGDIDPRRYNGATHEALRGVDQDRDRVEIFVACHAIKTQRPLLAICRGHQVLNVALGGTMYEDLATQFPGGIKHDYYQQGPRNNVPHSVDIVPGSRLAGILGRHASPVNSLHHQGVRDIAPGLDVVAVAPDGLVEAVEVRDHPFAIGVQWHPENLIDDDPGMLGLFAALVAAA